MITTPVVRDNTVRDGTIGTDVQDHPSVRRCNTDD